MPGIDRRGDPRFDRFGPCPIQRKKLIEPSAGLGVSNRIQSLDDLGQNKPHLLNPVEKSKQVRYICCGDERSKLHVGRIPFANVSSGGASVVTLAAGQQSTISVLLLRGSPGPGRARPPPSGRKTGTEGHGHRNHFRTCHRVGEGLHCAVLGPGPKVPPNDSNRHTCRGLKSKSSG